MYENNSATNLADLPQEPSKIWLWLGLGIAGYYLFKDNKPKRKQSEPSQTPSDLHGLSGNLRTCDAWFQTTDKRGKSVNRCFIYKPSCNTKKCKADTALSGLGEQKEVWQMTRQEYSNLLANEYDNLKRQRKSEFERKTKNLRSQAKINLIRTQMFPYNELSKEDFIHGYTKWHKDDIEQALLDGKPVPERVIKDYPSILGQKSKMIPEKQGQMTLFGVDTLEAFKSKHKLDKGVYYIDTAPVYDKKTKKLSHVLYTNQRGKYSPTGILISHDELQRNFVSATGNLSGYTATCKSWGKNKLGHKYCKSYAPTCKAKTDECRDMPAPIPGKPYKRTAKDTEEETKAIAQMLADEANDDLKQNKLLLREVIAYGGIAPHKGGFLKEEYSTLPDKYKRKEGIPLDELAQEMGMNEGELTDKIYMAEAQFRMLKEMRGGSTTAKFKADDFLDEAVQRMSSGRGFMGLSGIQRKGWEKPVDITTFPPIYQKAILNSLNRNDPIIYIFKEKGKLHTTKDWMTAAGTMENEVFVVYPKKHEVTWERFNRNTQKTSLTEVSYPTKIKTIAEKAGQMTLFGMSRKQLNSIMGIGV